MSDAKTLRAALLREPNFRWMMSGGLISALGDQFTLIALPWLVLSMTGDPLTLGLVIALMSVPRALFILVGGALVDRYSPKSVLMLSKYANALLLGLLTAMVLSGYESLAAVYALALGLGLASAFSIPSGTSMLPHVLAPAQLPMANGLMMGMRQLTLLSGPLLAALVFAVSGDGGAGLAGAAPGLAFAFGFDCFTFLFSAWTLSHVQTRQGARTGAQHGSVWGAIGSGLALVWNDVAMRTCMLYWALCAFIVGGTMQVALPVLAATRLQGASALGLVMGVHGAGTLLGMALIGALGKFRVGSFGTTVLAVDVMVALLLLPLGMVQATWQAAALLLAIGVLSGFMQVAVFSWIQQQVPPAMMGRAMSIFMFIFMGLAPMAAAVAGFLLQYLSLDWLFGGAGLFLLGTAALAWLATPMRAIGDVPPAGPV